GQLAVECGRFRARDDGDLQSAQAQCQCCEQTERSRPQDGGTLWPPDLEAALNLISLFDALFGDTHRLQEDTDILQPGGYFDDELGVIHVVFGQVAVSQVDAPLKVGPVGGHGIHADPVIEAAAGPPHRRHHVIPGGDAPHAGADLDDLPERFVPGDEKIVTVRCCAILGGVDLFVRAIDANPQHFDENATPIWNVIHTRHWEFCQVNTVRLAWEYCNCFHNMLLP